MFAPPIPLPLPVPVPLPLPGLPSPGQVMTGAGNAMQAIEHAVGDAIGGVIGAVTGQTPEGKRDLMIQLPDGRGGRVMFPEGVITTEQFREFARAVGQAFQAVRQDVMRLKSVTASVAAQGGGFYQPTEDNERTGIDPLMLILLLKDRDGSGAPTGDGLDTTTLLLLLMSEGGLSGGGGRMDMLTLLLALGKL
ncbi:MAG: hypothetical protein AB2A00_25820 [Myxococcota bacterium]